jgi:hypothetical protein
MADVCSTSHRLRRGRSLVPSTRNHNGQARCGPYDRERWPKRPRGSCTSPEGLATSIPSMPSTGSSSHRWEAGFAAATPSATASTRSPTSCGKRVCHFRRSNGPGRIWQGAGSTPSRYQADASPARGAWALAAAMSEKCGCASRLKGRRQIFGARRCWHSRTSGPLEAGRRRRCPRRCPAAAS